MNKKELKVRNKCRDICNSNDKEQSITLIKKEFPGCAIDVDMHEEAIGFRGKTMRMYTGMIMWEDIDIMF